MHDSLQDLYDVGARKFSVVSTSLVGCCPSQRLIAHRLQDPKGAIDEYGCLAPLNSLSYQLYPMFAAMLQDLSVELPGMNYSLANSTKMAEWVLETPASEPTSLSNERQAQLASSSSPVTKKNVLKRFRISNIILTRFFCHLFYL